MADKSAVNIRLSGRYRRFTESGFQHIFVPEKIKRYRACSFLTSIKCRKQEGK